MTTSMRPSTLASLGLGSVFAIFERGRLPIRLGDIVDEVFGPSGDRGSLVISGANGIVGAGKTMQLGARLEPFGIPIVALDFPGAADGIGGQYPGLVQAFGRGNAASIMANVIQLRYDGRSLPPVLNGLRPAFLLEAVPEMLEIKKAHYAIFRQAFPDLEIRSVTSGFPQSELGVGIAHPAFPHQINKVFEIVEPEPSPITKLLWGLGLLPMRVSDHWSFVLDVLFCGLTLAALRYHDETNMPYWKVDKLVRRLAGPNPFRAHDAIGARGANYLTWSCLHHLEQHYGGLFSPTPSLVSRKESGENWYPPNHFRPLVNWAIDSDGDDLLRTWILGPLFQMTAMMIGEDRSQLATMNAIGELCAQFTLGTPALIRKVGAQNATDTVARYHRLAPESALSPWSPEIFDRVESPEWQQLYVNAEHNGSVGVVSMSRESYSWEVDAELNRALDWLAAAGVERLILTGDFHLQTQMVGADTSDFFPAMEDAEQGVIIARAWSRTARRLYDDFAISVGLVNGKRCLGGMLELLMHCRYLIAVDGSMLGMPEVTLPVVPGMEGCHWPFRRCDSKSWPLLLDLLLNGRPVKASNTIGCLVDFSGSLEDSIQIAWNLANGRGPGIPERSLATDALERVSENLPPLSPAVGEAGRRAIIETIEAACSTPLSDALDVQARHSGNFMGSKACRHGVIGGLWKKTTAV